METEERHPLRPVYEVNERCLEMLVSAARADQRPSFALVSELSDLLRALPPAERHRAAHRTFLLVDMEFGNADWWQAARNHPSKPMCAPAWRGAFPRASAIQLARMTLMLAWHSLRADQATAGILLGMTRPVSDLIAELRFDEIDRIAEKRFRHVRPRWDDRPAVWRKLLLAAKENDGRVMREVNVHGVQLLTGDLLVPPRR